MSSKDLLDAINPLSKPKTPKVPSASDAAKEKRKATFGAAQKAALADKERFGREGAFLLGGSLGEVGTATRTDILG
jgi:hypothetical protein